VGTRSFRDLRAYGLAFELADQLRSRTLLWSSFDRWSVGIQLVRAADSIGANVAESVGRWHLPDQRRFLFIARGSLYETEHWIALADSRGLLAATEFEDGVSALGRALNGLINRRR